MPIFQTLVRGRDSLARPEIVRAPRARFRAYICNMRTYMYIFIVVYTCNCVFTGIFRGMLFDRRRASVRHTELLSTFLTTNRDQGISHFTELVAR